ncbi:MAG: hypothetical protein O8C63_03390 [Candidatus Methanoperedens sp.]|nr:hypothetical protein [Candidatus Methanoperedens sp.]
MHLHPHPRLPALPGTQARRITTDGAPGFHDGAGFIKMIYDKYYEIKIWRI